MLEHARTKARLQDSIYESMKAQIVMIEDHLKSANLFARNKHKVDQHSDTSYLPSQDMPNAWLCNNLLRFFASSPLYIQNHDGMPSLPTGIPNQQDNAEVEGPSIATLRSYLSSCSAKRLREDMKECSSPSVVSSNRVMQRLSALTREEVVQNWLREVSQASAILIQGNFPPNNIISPLSYLCAQITSMQTLTAKDPIQEQ
ncbi:hypothetical protein N8I77_002823 [Diaporthe amygdali]|uniref:Uncharacterized protein n=1 Tax=Phomopsis amygdali TaxID=1214568 RepID=A0AAD9WC63_PHOAM|nr:hypothetical protein N8I77_002823 [Diaporthe amygdali]